MAEPHDDRDLAARVAQLETAVAGIMQALGSLQERHDSLFQTVGDILQQVDNFRRLEEMVLFTSRTMDAMDEMIEQTKHLTASLIRELGEVKQDVTELAGQKASPGKLLEAYEARKKDRPNLSLKHFLALIGAGHRYRSVITERSRRKKRPETTKSEPGFVRQTNRQGKHRKEYKPAPVIRIRRKGDD